MEYSPIFGPNEKPVRKGWYAGCISETDLIDFRLAKPVLSDTEYRPDGNYLWWYWNGKHWASSPRNRARYSLRYWFGIVK